MTSTLALYAMGGSTNRYLRGGAGIASTYFATLWDEVTIRPKHAFKNTRIAVSNGNKENAIVLIEAWYESLVSPPLRYYYHVGAVLRWVTHVAKRWPHSFL